MPGDALVLLTHYPPAMEPLPTRSHAGAYSATIAALVCELRPVAVVAGHMHAWAGTVAGLTHAGGRSLLVMTGPGGVLLSVAADGTASAVRTDRP